jgi:hypothetical protein
MFHVENGMKLENLLCYEPDILRSVIIGKKSWGLHMKMWSGIGDGDFSKKEIIRDFEKHGITIPEPFLIDLDNSIKRRIIYHQKNNHKDNLLFYSILNHD